MVDICRAISLNIFMRLEIERRTIGIEKLMACKDRDSHTHGSAHYSALDIVMDRDADVG